MSSSISIYAGPGALGAIQKDGISPEQVKVIAGAAGGPKWFTLYGLDRYLMGDFFPRKKEILQTIGASAGAWRMACLGQKDPVAAIDRLAKFYAEETYSEKPDDHEVSQKAKIMLDRVLEENGVQEILRNPKIHTHIVTNRCKGLLTSANTGLQMLGLSASAFLNLFSRKSMQLFFDRIIFHSPLEAKGFFQLDSFPTTNVLLTQHNLKQALIASGAIPVVLEGVQNISGAPKGVYRDGGITDYHFDFPFLKNEGLVLYPHFSRTLRPGWFDKHVPWRKITADYYHNVVLVVPSEQHVANLPYGKITDRSDFKTLEDKPRINYFKTVLAESQRLGEDFQNLVEKGQGIEKILPLFPE